MLSIGEDEIPWTVSLERRRSCSLLFNDTLSRSSFSYLKLPPNLYKLSVLKLDASSFDVQVERTATVEELKQAVEDVFTQSPKEGQGKISWSHVWGHFCLCYEGQKLLNNKDYIRDFGIKDGDQLHFIRHLSINYNLVKRRSKKGSAACKQDTMSLSGPDICEVKEDNGEVCANGDGQEENEKHDHCEDGFDEDLMVQSEFKLAHFLRGWLSYSRLWYVGRKRSEGKFRPSRFSGNFLKMGSKITFTRI